MSDSPSLEVRVSGRSGIGLTVFGLGGGGRSRIGTGTGTAKEVLSVAAQYGVGYIDTAEVYGTEAVIGDCLSFWPRPPVLSSKLSYKNEDGSFKTAAEIEQSLQRTLERLNVDCLDIYFVHGVRPDEYSQVRKIVRPLFEELKQQGRIRATGITEMFNQDPGHRMLEDAVADVCWDFVMTGVNLLNRSALNKVIPKAQTDGTGVIVMFAVRNALGSWRALEVYLDSLNWLNNGRRLRLEELQLICGCDLPALAYRYVRDLPGVQSVLSGTSNPAHLRANIAAMHSPPLLQTQRDFIDDFFSTLPVCTGQ